MAESKSSTYETNATLVGNVTEYPTGEEDADLAGCFVVQVVDEDKGEIELHWETKKGSRYIRFRMCDLKRALAEFRK